ncbi:TetR family transcriptional regulator [Marinitenerispora sediminis]|uniref:TetR family transcriptional regulator n=1 Tax=Marinitenerispora sediminis TaxID=1931232 RepID=A0A368SZ57_9ACTN|nr:TetR family transcriptional regulator [Marinitenerispora sediminis]RCV48721.1 TetR family transcriptional regulator [Marinitenerispora sediminis]RCV50606.1 TetR family transcriptional regulator [Marinitenerispora sediminis]RCV50881.1 TetR family transcriptional regulator [Marinitenerispora sediminis]
MVERTVGDHAATAAAPRRGAGRTASAAVLERGFEATAADGVCAAAEISRSTLSRCLLSKRDALFGEMADSGERLRDDPAARPGGEALRGAMRHALDPLIEGYEARDERTRRRTRPVTNTSPPAARHREKNARWQELPRPEIARRLGADPAEIPTRAPTP